MPRRCFEQLTSHSGTQFTYDRLAWRDRSKYDRIMLIRCGTCGKQMRKQAKSKSIYFWHTYQLLFSCCSARSYSQKRCEEERDDGVSPWNDERDIVFFFSLNFVCVYFIAGAPCWSGQFFGNRVNGNG